MNPSEASEAVIQRILDPQFLVDLLELKRPDTTALGVVNSEAQDFCTQM